LATLAVILASLQRLRLGELVDFSEAGSEIGKHGASLEVSGVQAHDLRKGRSMGVDERGYSSNRGESGREMHFEMCRSVKLLNYLILIDARGKKGSEWIVEVNSTTH
jgi:hypothetical protein